MRSNVPEVQIVKKKIIYTFGQLNNTFFSLVFANIELMIQVISSGKRFLLCITN